MIHYSSQSSQFRSNPAFSDRRLAIETAETFREIGIETVKLTTKLVHNTHKMMLSAATNKDVRDVCRTLSAYMDVTYRDVSENAEAITRIWWKYMRETVVRDASAHATFNAYRFAPELAEDLIS
jgi:N-glycosylase/DNA lyase